MTEAEQDDEDYVRESAEAWGRIEDWFASYLADVRVVKIGPAAVDGSLAVDMGIYLYLIVGRASSGELAGLMVGSVET